MNAALALFLWNALFGSCGFKMSITIRRRAVLVYCYAVVDDWFSIFRSQSR